MRSAVLAVLITLLAAAPAQARHRHPMTFEFAVMVAADYWQQRGVIIPCHPSEELLSWEETRPWLQGHSPTAGGAPEMMTSVATCTIDITPWANSWRTDPGVAADYCWDIAHEVGHIAGLEHPDQPGISDEMRRLVTGTVMDSTNGAPYPFGCAHPRQWAVLNGYHQPPRWVRHAPAKARRLWLAGHVRQAKRAARRGDTRASSQSSSQS